MLKKQFKVFPEEEETQGFCNFDVYLLIVGTNGRNRGCLVQERKRDDDSDWKFKYQSRELLKSEDEEIVMDDNQEDFYCCREQEGMDYWVVVRAGARETAGFQQDRAKVKSGAC